jgi:hypothetical protein
MDDEYDKLQMLFERMLDRTLVEVYINENDDFVMEFDDGTLIELFSEDGDLGIYYEMGSGDVPQLH